MIKFTVLIAFLFSSILSCAQQGATIYFIPEMNDQPLVPGENDYLPEIRDSVKIEALKFYISDVQFFQDEQLVYTLEKKHLLIDVEKPESMVIDFTSKNQMKFDRIKFNIGIDSLTNVSGAFGGDLDPTNGMYWTWQSGYINFKLEGVAKICQARNHLYQFHLGGYQAPFNTLQQVTLKTAKGESVKINIAIDKLLTQIDLEKTYQVMSPNNQAMEMAKLIPSIFTIAE